MEDTTLDSYLSDPKAALVRPNSDRAKYAQILIGITLFVNVLGLLFGWFQYNLLSDVKNGANITMEQAETNDLRVQGTAIIYMIVYIISVVCFIMWFRRAYYNINQRIECRHTDGWAAGFWFIPIASLFKPYQIMKEMWVKTSQVLLPFQEESGGSNGITLINSWWFFWIVGIIGGNISFRMTSNAAAVDELIEATVFDMAIGILSIPLSILAISMIRKYNEMEYELYTYSGLKKED